MPNALSFARLLGVPFFLWLILIEADWWALGLLVLAGLSDWLDGKLARALDQTSRLGVMLDPAADRLYILATLIGLTVRDIIPLWLVIVLVGRELAIVPIAPIVRRLGYSGTLPVHFAGKAATLCLLYAFPLLLLGEHGGGAAVAEVIGWAFAIWGTGLYWWAALLYWEQTRRLVLAARAERRGEPPPGIGGARSRAPSQGPAKAPPKAPPEAPPGRSAGDQKGAETRP